MQPENAPLATQVPEIKSVDSVTSVPISKPATTLKIVSDIKEGYKTTEFWLSTLVTVGGAIGIVVPGDSALGRVASAAAATASAVAYTITRAQVKASK